MSASLSDLAGRLTVRPGAPLPQSLHSTRRDWAPRLTAGCPADQLPQRVASLYTLCAQAHRLTAERAVQTALNGTDRPVPSPPSSGSSPSAARRLRVATARDQVLRIGHDWVRLAGGEAAADHALPTLRGCPLWREEWSVDDRLAALPDWLAHRWLGQPVTDWWHAWQADPWQHPLAWAQRTDTAPAQLLTRLHPLLAGRAPSGLALNVLDDPQTHLPALAQGLATEPGFALQPTWRGQPAETGPWTRHHHRWPASSSTSSPSGTAQPPTPSLDAWQRLVSRLVDLVRLALPDGDEVLHHGSLSLGDGRALAWSEMARGLLIHTVQLEHRVQGPVVTCGRVLAPTEWNFHPRGVAAQAVAGLGDDPQAALVLVAAFDPCVDVTLDVWKDVPHA